MFSVSWWVWSGVAFGQSFTIDGACPGEVDLTFEGTTPGGEVVILASADTGAAVVPGGPCAGVDSGLADGLRWWGPFPDADGDGRVALRPTLPISACDKSFVGLDLSSCVPTLPTMVGEDLVAANPECVAYATLDEDWRNVSFNDGDGGVEECDTELSGWYRFEGAAGTRMPEAAPDLYDCGTDAPGWIDGTHPVGLGETTTETVCYHWSGSTCNWSNPIQVTNCGPYFVYELNTPPTCMLIYCGE